MNSHGANISRLIIGCMRWGKWGKQMNTSEYSTLIDACSDLGYSSYDHADIYGDHTTETEFGKGLSSASTKRTDLYIISKCGIVMPREERNGLSIKYYDTSTSYIINQVEQSLLNLKTDYLDLLLIHRPSPMMSYQEIAEAFQNLHAAGKVKSFGVSNFTPIQFESLHSLYPLETNQVEASVLHLSPFTDGTFDQCQRHNVKPQIWSPLAGGSIFNPQTKKEQRLSETINKLAENHGQPMANIALRFLLEHPTEPQIVLGSSKLDRLKESINSLSFNLELEDWFKIWTASTGQEVP